MSETTSLQKKSNHSFFGVAAWIAGGMTLLVAFIAVSLFLQTPIGQPLAGFLKSIFATDSVQIMWFITRSAGITAYLVLWFSMAWGLAVSSKIFDRMLHRSFTFDFHEFISLLAIGFVILHIVVLMFDRYLPYSLAQILVPFISPYRPFWVGVGVLGFYLMILVTVTFYLRSKIGMKAFRSIHLFSLLSYLGVTAHSFFSGTDSSLPAVQIMYASTFLTTVFLTAYYLIFAAQKKKSKRPAAPVLAPAPVRHSSIPSNGQKI